MNRFQEGIQKTCTWVVNRAEDTGYNNDTQNVWDVKNNAEKVLSFEVPLDNKAAKRTASTIVQIITSTMIKMVFCIASKNALSWNNFVKFQILQILSYW